ncbi:uncharacterized protein B0P05DRAFT_545109 [Gilbertella persicaria]|uniref:uncharacterized protein n=1 Tax=Gilbertella persicaria TaxID=101096 RepID=UPI00221F172C|nr:uncharacterized protein B0P05DRAFT_545109 [Gilbertella persicaria]KAI8076605.1 hypothetical protein B0P05DRAFT_545109 [Gilbertella persicaria]
MFNNKASIENLTAEVLIHITRYLPLETILQFSLTCKTFSHLIKDELVFRQLAERDFSVSDKTTEQSWLNYYKELKQKPIMKRELKLEHVTTINATTTKEGACPHLEPFSEPVCDIKRIIYKGEHIDTCDICHSQPAQYLNMYIDNHNGACLACLKQTVVDENHYPIQLKLETGHLYCFQCPEHPRKLTQERDGDHISQYLDAIHSEEAYRDLDKRRKIEQNLYIQELRREDMSLKHYLVEKQWGRTWMLFRTREGSPLPARITNNKLARTNGTLDPNIRLPMDKYRPSPETHGDIVSEKLWRYLEKAYGVQGRAYSEDDIVAPEYARLRVYVDDYKKSIHLYP